MNERAPLQKKRILFVCSGNACRSQIAEGWARASGNNHVEVFSAGVEAHGLDPLAVAAMAEAGIDISWQRSKSLIAMKNVRFDCAIALSERAVQSLRDLRVRSPIVSWVCDSPTRRSGGKVPSLDDYRNIRDEIRGYVSALLRQTKVTSFQNHANHPRQVYSVF